MEMIETSKIMTGAIIAVFGLISMLAGAATIWLFTSVLKLRKDMNHAFTKLRDIDASNANKNDIRPSGKIDNRKIPS